MIHLIQNPGTLLRQQVQLLYEAPQPLQDRRHFPTPRRSGRARYTVQNPIRVVDLFQERLDLSWGSTGGHWKRSRAALNTDRYRAERGTALQSARAHFVIHWATCIYLRTWGAPAGVQFPRAFRASPLRPVVLRPASVHRRPLSNHSGARSRALRRGNPALQAFAGSRSLAQRLQCIACRVTPSLDNRRRPRSVTPSPNRSRRRGSSFGRPRAIEFRTSAPRS